MKKGDLPTLVILVVLAALGMRAVLYATKQPMGFVLDSYVYASAADNLAHGSGLVALSYSTGKTAPMTHFPPLYPLLLCLGDRCGLAPMDAARAINVVSLGLLIFLVGLIVWRHTGGSSFLTILAAMLLLASRDVLRTHFMVLSEPVFLVLAFGALAALSEFLQRGGGTGLLILGGLLIAAAFLTRYVGATLVLAAVAALLILGKTPFKRRVLQALVLGCISCGPILAWLVFNRLRTGAATNRQLVFHPIGASHLRDLLGAVVAWVLPTDPLAVPSRRVLMVVLALAALALALSVWMRTRPNRRKQPSETPCLQLPKVLALFVAVYLGFLVVSISFFDFSTPLNDRILLPVYISVVLIVACAAHRISLTTTATPLDSLVARGVAAVVMLVLLLHAAILVFQSHTDGPTVMGHLGKYWKHSSVVQEVKQLPPGAPVYTNAPDLLYFFAGRTTDAFPYKTVSQTTLKNPNYEADLAAMADNLEKNQGLFVYFNEVGRKNMPRLEELMQRVPLQPVRSDADATVCRLGPPPPSTRE